MIKEIGQRPYVTQEIRGTFQKIPRRRLARLPTPLDNYPNLSATLNGPEIYLKREDMTGLGLGGNDVRVLEFITGEMLARGSDNLLVGNVDDVDFYCSAAAAAAKLGIHATLVMEDQDNSSPDITSYLEDAFSAEVKTPKFQDRGERTRKDLLLESKKKLKRNQKEPFAVDQDVVNTYSAVANVETLRELYGQLGTREDRTDCIIVPATFSAGIIGGLVLGVEALGLDIEVIGFSPAERIEELTEQTYNAVSSARDILDLAVDTSNVEFKFLPTEIDKDVGLEKKFTKSFCNFVTQTEGVILKQNRITKTHRLLWEIKHGCTSKMEKLTILWSEPWPL